MDCCNKNPCDRQASFPQWVLPDGSESHICPRLLIDPDTHLLVNYWYTHYKNGLLPVAGGVLDQSAYFADAMQTVEKWKRINGNANSKIHNNRNR